MARTVGMILEGARRGGEEDERFVCPHCGREYRSAAALRAHAKEKHPEAFDTTDHGDGTG